MRFLRAIPAAALAALAFTVQAGAQSAAHPAPKHPVLHGKGLTATCKAWRGKTATGGSTSTAANGVAPNSKTPPLAQQQTQPTLPHGATVTTNGKTVTTTTNRGTAAVQTRTCATPRPSRLR